MGQWRPTRLDEDPARLELQLASMLPTHHSKKRTIENIKDPLYRFSWEVNFGVKLLSTVRQDLEDVVAIPAVARSRPTTTRPDHTLTRGMIPRLLVADKKVPDSCSVAAKAHRLLQPGQQLTSVSKAVGSSGSEPTEIIHNVWMGGLSNPGPHSCDQQCVAQANSWVPGGELLDVTVADETDQPQPRRLQLRCRGTGCLEPCRANQLSISAEIHQPAPDQAQMDQEV